MNTRFLVKHCAVLICLMVLLAAGGCSNPTDEEYVARAKHYIDNGELSAAVVELKNALQKNPDNGEARKLLGEAYVVLGDGGAAQKELQKALSLGIKAEVVRPSLANALLLQGHYLDVISLEIPKDIQSDDAADMHISRGEALLGLSKFDDASREFRMALELEPDAKSAMVGMAKLLMRGGYREARTWLDKAIEIDSEYAPAWSVIGDLSRFEGKAEAAIDAYNRAIELRQDNISDRYKKSLVLLNLKRYEEAATEIAILKKQAPRNPGVNYIAGVLEFGRGRYDQAERDFEDTLKSSPNFIPAALFLGTTQLLQGQIEQAESYLSQYVKARPQHVPGRKLLAYLRLRAGNFKTAEDLARPLLTTNPEDPFVLNVLAQALVAQGKSSEALKYLQKINDLAPTSAKATTRLGLGLLSDDKTEEAISVLETAVTLDQKVELADILLVLSLMKQSRFDAALAATGDYGERFPGSPMPRTLRGIAYIGLKDEGKARQAFQDGLRVSPGDPAANYNLASLALKSNDFSTAKKHYEAVLNVHKGHLETLLKLASLGARQGDDALVRESLEHAVAANPTALEPQILLGRYYLDKGEAEKVLSLMGKAQVQYAENLAVLALVGEAQLATDDADSAEGNLLRLVEQVPKSPQAHFLLAKTYDRLGKTKKLRHELDKVLELNPHHIQARIALVRLLVSEGKVDESNANVAILREKHGNNADVLSLEGLLALTNNQPDRALLAYQKAFDTAPSGERLVALSRARWAAGHRMAAAQEMEGWTRQYPKDVPVLLALGNAYLNLDRQQDAISVYSKVVETSPDNLIALNNLAYLLRKREPDNALSYAKRAREIDPDSAAIMDTFALVLLERGDVEQAQRVIDGALLKVPGDRTLSYHKALILAKSGKNGEARVLLERLLSQKEKFAERDEAQALFDSL